MAENYSEIRALVVGAGSIGRRHARNLVALRTGVVALCDSDSSRMSELHSDHPIQFSDYDAAIQAFKPNVVFVCTPPAFHIGQARRALEANADVFIEKPLSHSFEGVTELAERRKAINRRVQIGYNLRHNPGLRLLRDTISDGSLGRIVLARAEYGQYLPTWRPTQDYKASYTSRSALGGGIILDSSHEIDYMLWMLGMPAEVYCVADHVSDLITDVEDSATIVLRYPGRTIATILVDMVQPGYSRKCRIVGESGIAEWDYTTRSLRIYHSADDAWTEMAYSFESNEMYVAEVELFLDAIVNRSSEPDNLDASASVLTIAIAALHSSASKQPVSIT